MYVDLRQYALHETSTLTITRLFVLNTSKQTVTLSKQAALWLIKGRNSAVAVNFKAGKWWFTVLNSRYS